MNHPRINTATINAFPDLNLRVLGRSYTDGPFFRDKKFFFFASGRAAIHSAAKAIANGRRLTVYLPAFHCGVEVEAFIRAGYQPRFYAVDEALNVQLPNRDDDLIPGSIFFLIHYFGFPQRLDRIVTFCRNYQMILMEDCAHSLYSRHQGVLLGKFGDLSVFSPRKTLAMPNGGGLLINMTNVPDPVPVRRRFNPILYKSALRSICEYEMKKGGLSGTLCGAFVQGISRLKRPSSPEEMETADESILFYDDNRFSYDLGISPLSKLFFEPMPVDEIVARRRENYVLLASSLAQRTDWEFVFAQLPEGTSPLCLPVWVDNSDRWMRELRALGVEAFVFGRKPHPRMFGELLHQTEQFRSRILGLPVHQDLSRDDIVDLAHRINKITR